VNRPNRDRTGRNVRPVQRPLAVAAVVALALVLVGCEGTGGDAQVSDAGGGAAAGPSDFVGVRGRVLTSDGAPVAGAVVAAAALPGTTAAVPELGVITGPDGSYAWPLPPGRFQLSVQGEQAVAAVSVAVEPGKATEADIRF